MFSSRKLSVDPESLDGAGFEREIRIVVPFVGTRLTRRVLQRVRELAGGLDAQVRLVAVHTAPYPREFHCPTATHGFLVEQLVGLASECPLPVESEVVLARTHADGYRHALDPESLVVVGSRKRLWRTDEEKLARALAADGHRVALLHLEDRDA